MASLTGRHHVLLYDYVPDVVERRAPHREAHLGYLGKWIADGRALMGGAVGDPPHGAVIVFTCPREEVEAFASADPYVAAGLVTSWRVEPWNVVVSVSD
jgi:uncharacterized protein YciI